MFPYANESGSTCVACWLSGFVNESDEICCTSTPGAAPAPGTVLTAADREREDGESHEHRM